MIMRLQLGLVAKKRKKREDRRYLRCEIYKADNDITHNIVKSVHIRGEPRQDPPGRCDVKKHQRGSQNALKKLLKTSVGSANTSEVRY